MCVKDVKLKTHFGNQPNFVFKINSVNFKTIFVVLNQSENMFRQSEQTKKVT